MNKNAKMTRATALSYVLTLDAVKQNAEVSAVLSGMLTQLNKPRKATERKVNPEVAERRERILSILSASSEAMTCAAVAQSAGMSQAQANAGLKSLIDAGMVKREVVARVAMFSAVTE